MMRSLKNVIVLFGVLVGIAACVMRGPVDPQVDLVARGRALFFNETFDGNGRTCGTCHRAEDNFGLTPAFIATLPADDPLFVAETNSALAKGFENPVLMREFGLILENQDGFEDLDKNFNMRGVPHILAMRNSVASRLGPRTGWAGDGAPDPGSLRDFATGAVNQHFPKTTARVPGKDFRLPTGDELDALEAFQLSLGRQADLILPLSLSGVVASRGQEIFLDNTLGKCNVCHLNAGANGDPNIFGPGVGNLNFNTGVEALPDQPADLTNELVPEDDGFGTPGDGEFNTPTLVEAADTGPFFHNNSVETIEGAVAFYTGDAFTNSPAGQLIIGATGSGINLDATQVVEVAAFLRVINALENIRGTLVLLQEGDLDLAVFETQDAIDVLSGGGLHPKAVQFLKTSRNFIKKAERSYFHRHDLINKAIEFQARARVELKE